MKKKPVLTTLATITMMAIAAFAQNNDLIPDAAINHSSFHTPQNLVTVTNIDELYSAINRPTIIPTRVILAPGVYMLSATDANQMPRPNGGRIDLKQDMSIQGVEGDRSAVIIDAINLPPESYVPDGLPNTGAIRVGRGTNAIEWLTLRNAIYGAGGIETDINSGATSFVRIAHIVSTGNARGIDIRNFGAEMTGRTVVAQIVDNDLFDNQISPGYAGKQGLRVVNVGTPSGVLIVEMSGNRCHDNAFGLIAENNVTSNAIISITSTGDRFYQNGLGASIGGGWSNSNQMANNNMVSFTADGSSFDNNNGANDFFQGGLHVFGGLTRGDSLVTTGNTVRVSLINCFLLNNQFHDLFAEGALSVPETIGSPGINNRVTVYLHDTVVPVLVTTNSIPMFRRDGNIARVFNFSTTKQTP